MDDDLPPGLKRELAAFNPTIAAGDDLPPISVASKDRWLVGRGMQKAIEAQMGISRKGVTLETVRLQ